MGKDLGKEKEIIRCRKDAAEYAGQEDSTESACWWVRSPVQDRILESWSWGSRLSSGRFGSGVTRRQGS